MSRMRLTLKGMQTDRSRSAQAATLIMKRPAGPSASSSCWTFGQFELRNGWQTLDLGLPDANKLGDFYSGAINWFRFYHGHEMVGNTTVKFDEIRFYYKTIVDACEDNRPWSSNGAAVTLDEADCKEGESSISTTNGPQGIRLSRTYSPVIKTPAKLAKGHFQFWLYVSDAAKFNAVDTQVEITSSGKADVNELHWLLPKDLPYPQRRLRRRGLHHHEDRPPPFL